jgi:MFS family permease
VLLLALVGYVVEWILRPVVPLVVLARAGDASLVGIVSAAYAVPALIFRQSIGTAVDTGRGAVLARIGTAAMMIGSLALLVPNTIVLTATRFVQGLGWSLVSVASQTAAVRLAPGHRRAEVSGYFATIPAFGALVGPAVGVALFTAGGVAAPVALAAALSLVVLGLAVFAPRTVASVPSAAMAPDATPVTDARGETRGRAILRYVAEPSAVAPMTMTACMTAGQALFVVFAPVFAAIRGLDTAGLAGYYLVYGGAFVVSQLVVGPFADRLGRGRSLTMAVAFAIVGLALAAFAVDLVVLAIAGCIYVVGSSLFNATAMALTADLAPHGRLGSAVATFSIGYQIGGSGSAIVWGPLIDRVGYPWPYLFAIVLVVVVLLIGRRLAAGVRAGGDEPIGSPA